MPVIDRPKLDAREAHFRLPSHHAGLSLFLRYLAPVIPSPEPRIVLYVHGATFPSALSIAHRFDGHSWRDDLVASTPGRSTFTGSARSPTVTLKWASRPRTIRRSGALKTPAVSSSAPPASFVRTVSRLSLIAHSWGTIVAGDFAGRCPALVDRMVFFGPITRRPPRTTPVRLPAWRLISVRDQWERFIADVPPDEPPVLLKRHFAAWSEAYLEGDPESRSRSPAAVKTPSGAFQDILDAWAGELAYEPGLVRAPVAIIRGAWDGMCTDEDARWLFDALKGAPLRRDIKIGAATHLMHLEASRYALHREAQTFLEGGEGPATPGTQACPALNARSK